MNKYSLRIWIGKAEILRPEDKNTSNKSDQNAQWEGHPGYF